MKSILIVAGFLLAVFYFGLAEASYDLNHTLKENPKNQQMAEELLLAPAPQEPLCQLSNETVARSGCCSSHGGVCGCDSRSDRIECCDGTLSPSCTCSGY